jgi:hypothetical protein
MGEEMRILSISPCGTSKSSFTAHKILTWDLPALLPIREEGVLRIFIALKNPSPWRPDLKLQPLGPWQAH